MRIGIDIDDTLINVKEELKDAALKYAKSLGKKVKDTNNVVDKGNDGNIYQQIYGFNYEELKYFLGPIQESITSKALPRKGSVDVVKKFHDEGNEIYIITARDKEFHDAPYKQSKEWLNRNGIYFDKLIVNARDKAKVCLENGIDLLIDDNIDNCLQVRNCGIEAIMIGEETSREVVTFADWDAICNFVLDGKIVKIIPYSIGYMNEISDFINESMFRFLGREYKERVDVLNIEEFYFNNNGGFWLAIDVVNKQIVGSIGLDNQGEFGLLRRFYVDKVYQKLGIGSRLFKQLYRYAIKNTTIKKIYLACSKRLEVAHIFYLKYGFVKIDKIEEDVNISISSEDDYFVKEVER